MKTVIIFNTINRPQMVKTTMVDNIKKAGISDISVIVTNNGGTAETNLAIQHFAVKVSPVEVEMVHYPKNIGNPASLNEMLHIISEFYSGVKYIAKLDDDIEMPTGWLLKAIGKISEMENLNLKPGIVGFNWGFLKKDREQFNAEIQCYTPIRVFGSWVFPYAVFKKFGYFAELSKYGCWDSEFNNRLLSSGYTNIYLNGYDSKHIGADAGTHSEYRHMKNNELHKAQKLYQKVCEIRPSKITWDNRKFWENE